MKIDGSSIVFLELLKAGLWERDVQLSKYGPIDLKAVCSLAQEQSVIGLIAAGLEHVIDVKVKKEDALVFAGEALQIEQRNKAMNDFIGVLVEKLRKEDIYALLVKGQGIAQCYERPLWRSCGDVDLFLSNENYKKAKNFVTFLAPHVDEEDKVRQHLALTLEGWIVELHGTLHSRYSKRVDKGLDVIKIDIFEGGQVRSWMNGNTQVFLPSVDNDIIIIFTHILQHFFNGGIGLRQVCDWCRLLWTYRYEVNLELLRKRLQYMGLISEWKAFAALAVDNLEMPIEAMPLYSDSPKWGKKAESILALVLETGNFGHGREMSYKDKYSFPIRLFISFSRHIKDTYRQSLIFPLDSMKAMRRMIWQGVKVAVKGENHK